MRRVSTVRPFLVALALAGPSAVAAAPAAKAVPSAELTDPAGDVHDQNGPGNDRDVVKLSLGSDGTNILVGAVLAEDERGTMAGGVVELFLDTDGNQKTGATDFWGKDAKPPKIGFEYVARLSVCMSYDAGRIGACAGGPSTPPRSRHARIRLDEFKGAPGEQASMMNSTTLIDDMGIANAPFTGRLLQGKIPYAEAGLKSGQVVRIVSRESGQPGAEGFFADVLLALK